MQDDEEVESGSARGEMEAGLHGDRSGAAAHGRDRGAGGWCVLAAGPTLRAGLPDGGALLLDRPCGLIALGAAL